VSELFFPGVGHGLDGRAQGLVPDGELDRIGDDLKTAAIEMVYIIDDLNPFTRPIPQPMVAFPDVDEVSTQMGPAKGQVLAFRIKETKQGLFFRNDWTRSSFFLL
jgi:hypothetical protein